MIPLGAILAVTLAFPAVVFARTWNVRPDGSGDAPTIQAAVDRADAFDIVELESGTFNGPGNRDIQVALPLTFRSQYDLAAKCTIDCQGTATENHRGFEITSECEFRGLTIANGWVSGTGGAIYAADGIGARIVGCVFVDNTAGSGGALGFDSLDLEAGGPRARAAEVQVENSMFLRNQAAQCGVAYFLNVRIAFAGCAFVSNAAEVGGVAHFVNADPSFADCLFLWNEAALLGGAVSCDDPAIFERCTFVANAAPRGAHIATANIDGNTIVGNSILVFGQGGEAVACNHEEVVLTCSDVFGNEGGDFVGCLEFLEGASGNISADPLFCDAKAGDCSVRSDSPCAAENGGGCGTIGARDVGCVSASVTDITWGALKALHR